LLTSGRQQHIESKGNPFYRTDIDKKKKKKPKHKNARPTKSDEILDSETSEWFWESIGYEEDSGLRVEGTTRVVRKVSFPIFSRKNVCFICNDQYTIGKLRL